MLAVPLEGISWLEHGDLQQLRQSEWGWHVFAGEEIGTHGKMAAMLVNNSHQLKEHPETRSREGTMKQIWISVLGDIVSENNIGSESDFFLIGGNSLLPIRIQNEVHKQFGILLPLRKLFGANTLAQMVLLDKPALKDNAFHESGADID